jgi:N4-gp56 family major capsid protein
VPTTPATSTTTSTMSNLIQTAYDKYIEFNLRSEPMFRKFADKRPVDVTNPGNTIVFQVYTDLSRATTALTQTEDPDAVTLSNTNKVNVTVNEYGNAVITTERLALESLSAIDPAVADMLSFNMRDSLDSLVWAKLVGLATGRYTGTSSADESTLNGQDVSASTTAPYLTAALARKGVSKLRGASVQPRDGGFYTALIHPDVSYDLRSEAQSSGSAVWQLPHTYTEGGVGNLWSGEIGIFDQVRYIETPRAESLSGSGTAKIYKTVIMGKQALLEAVSYEPKTVIGPVTDKLMRFRPAGWKGLLGWNVFRPEARYVVTSKSSIAS